MEELLNFVLKFYLWEWKQGVVRELEMVQLDKYSKTQSVCVARFANIIFC